MKKKSTLIKFGEEVEGYAVPVLNEREIRAAAGILFVLMLISLMLILFKGDFLLIKYVIIVFLTDLLIRVFINPMFSPSLIIGRLIVSRQTPEYVGAAQKKFAWKIGIIIASLMFFLLVIVNSYSILTGLGCLICLVFLFFESAFGICLGCLVYGWFYKNNVLYCAGESCLPKKQSIQKTSVLQILVLLGLFVFILLAIVFFNDQFNEKPGNLWEIIRSW
ncbi:MAG: DUF4395 domain-containing protein [Chitinophagaceae bacterium]